MVQEAEVARKRFSGAFEKNLPLLEFCTWKEDWRNTAKEVLECVTRENIFGLWEISTQ
jgi:hypothetical protein